MGHKNLMAVFVFLVSLEGGGREKSLGLPAHDPSTVQHTCTYFQNVLSQMPD